MTKTIISIDGTNGEFEYYQYNNDLKLIHSVKDDMFQAKSIVESLKGKREANKWMLISSSQELIEGFKKHDDEIGVMRKYIDIKEKYNNSIRFTKGLYIHRLLINHFAFWVSPIYAYKIAILLDNKFEMERLQKENLTQRLK